LVGGWCAALRHRTQEPNLWWVFACTQPTLQRDADMIGRLNHVAIAVRDIGKAAAVYWVVLGAYVSAAVPQPDHGVTTVFITLPNTKIELLEPLGDASPIAKFLE